MTESRATNDFFLDLTLYFARRWDIEDHHRQIENYPSYPKGKTGNINKSTNGSSGMLARFAVLTAKFASLCLAVSLTGKTSIRRNTFCGGLHQTSIFSFFSKRSRQLLTFITEIY